MEDFLGLLEILWYPFLACMVIAALHCYMGLHVIRRGLIFVDLSMAQVAALGGAVAVLIGPMMPWEQEPHDHAQAYAASNSAIEQLAPPQEEGFVQGEDAYFIAGEGEHGGGTFGYVLALAFVFLGAMIFSFGRFRDYRIHIAIIGIVYVVSTAVSLLVLSKTAHGSEEMDAMLLGNILFADWPVVRTIALLYLALAIPHFIWGKTFLRISNDINKAEAEGVKVRLWDLLFFAIFGVMVTQSVRIGGVLVVFSYLVIPGICAFILFPKGSIIKHLVFAWCFAIVATIGGFWFSSNEKIDMPLGSSLVASFGFTLVVCCFFYWILLISGKYKEPAEEPTAE
jgi:zinc/manganese transport system permease protein